MGRFGTGQAVRRTEDQRFLTGSGRYTDDITLPEQTYLHLFRSPYPHGRISTLDIDEIASATSRVNFTGTANWAPLVINEWMASNAGTLADPADDPDPGLEIVPMRLEGRFLISDRTSTSSEGRL